MIVMLFLLAGLLVVLNVASRGNVEKPIRRQNPPVGSYPIAREHRLLYSYVALNIVVLAISAVGTLIRVHNAALTTIQVSTGQDLLTAQDIRNSVLAGVLVSIAFYAILLGMLVLSRSVKTVTIVLIILLILDVLNVLFSTAGPLYTVLVNLLLTAATTLLLWGLKKNKPITRYLVPGMF